MMVHSALDEGASKPDYHVYGILPETRVGLADPLIIKQLFGHPVQPRSSAYLKSWLGHMEDFGLPYPHRRIRSIDLSEE